MEMVCERCASIELFWLAACLIWHKHIKHKNRNNNQTIWKGSYKFLVESIGSVRHVGRIIAIQKYKWKLWTIRDVSKGRQMFEAISLRGCERPLILGNFNEILSQHDFSPFFLVSFCFILFSSFMVFTMNLLTIENYNQNNRRINVA